MSLTAKLGSRFVLLVFGRFLLLVLGLATTAILTRQLGPAGFGHYRAAVAYLSLVVVFADLGLGSIFVREISREGADQARIIGNTLVLRLLVSSGVMLLALMFSVILAFDDAERLSIFAGACGFVAYSIHLLLFGLFQQKLRQEGAVLAEVSGGLVLLATVVVLSVIDAGPLWFVLSLGSSYAFALAISLLFARRLVRFRLRIEPEQWRSLVRAAMPLAGASTLLVLYIRADSVLLALLQNPEEVGLYGVPIKISDSIMGIALLFIGLFAPLLAKSAMREPRQFMHLLDHGLATMVLGSVGSAVVLNALAADIVHLLAGSAFAEATLILRLLTVVMVLHTATLMLREAIVALDMQHRLLPGYFAGAVVALIAYILLIPPYAGAGAAVALIITECLVLSYVMRVLRSATTQTVSLRIPLKAVACGVGACLVLYYVAPLRWGWASRLGIGLLIYFALLLVTRALTLPKLWVFTREMFAASGTDSSL